MALQLENIKERLRKGLPVSAAENVAFIKNDPEGMAAFMINNNAGNVNQTLRKLGYSHLGYIPNKVALARQMQIFIDKADKKSFDEVVKNFNVNRKLLSGEFLFEFDKNFITK